MRSRLLTFPALSALLVGLVVPDLALAKKKADKEKEAAAEEVNLDEESSKDADKDKDADKEASSDGEEKKEGEEAASEGDGEKKEEASGSSDSAPSDSGADADKSPVEEKGKSYYFAGVRARAVVVPTFIIEAFGEGGQTVMGPQIGPEFAIRKDGFEYDFAITYTTYPMDRTPFKAPTDPDQAMELVESHIKVLYFSTDFLWGHQFSPVVSLLYGGSVGLGFVWGPLYRSQAYRNAQGGWSMCVGPNNPGGQAGYCAPDPQHGDKQHFGMYEEPSWSGGGDKPLIMPWLALQTGLRIKPHRRFVGRLDFGIGIGQVFFGIGADYGI
jgi:hypothetical protein